MDSMIKRCKRELEERMKQRGRQEEGQRRQEELQTLEVTHQKCLEHKLCCEVIPEGQQTHSLPSFLRSH